MNLQFKIIILCLTLPSIIHSTSLYSPNKSRESMIYEQNLNEIFDGEHQYIDYKYGKLDLRSLIFKFQNFKKNKIQKCVQYNFPNDFKYTRSVEIKHVTKQSSKFTVISKEYPTSKGEPYYPISNKKNVNLFKKYEKLITKEKSKNIFFEGRLAKYKYFNTDEVIDSALSLFDSLKKKYKNNL